MKTVLVSAVALIDRDGRVLLAQRPKGKTTRPAMGISWWKNRAGGNSRSRTSSRT